MILSPFTVVECDQCGHKEEFDLEPMAGGLWSDRSVEDSAARGGWIIRDQGERTFCQQECADAYDDDAACAAQERRDSGR